MGRKWIVLLVVILCQSVQAGKPVNVALKGGLELTEMTFSGHDLDDSNRAGFYIGPMLGISLPVVGLGIDVSLLYNQRSLKVDGERLKQKSLLIPANLRYAIDIGDALGIFFSGGPQLAFNVGKDIYYWKDEQQDNHQYILQNTLVSFNFGAGVHIGPRVEAGIYYNIPLGKTADFTWDKLSSELRETTWSRAKSKTNAWHIALALYF